MTRHTHVRRLPLRAAAAGLAVALTGALAACGPSHSPGSAKAAQHPSISTVSPHGVDGRVHPTLHTVTNDGHQLAFYVTPGRQPAIVLDSGGGEDHTQWNAIVPVLAQTTRSEIITYDRAGMGASAEVRGPWKVGNAIADLEAGLKALGATDGIVLVAHSEAGEIAAAFAHGQPEQVRGAVLVDPSLPEFYTDTEIARIQSATLPEIAALRGRPSTKQTRQLLALAADYGPWHRAYHRLTWPTSVPVTVIESATTPFPTSPTDAQAWRTASQEFAHAAGNRRLVVAAHSSHEVPTDRPDSVIEQVQRIVQQVG